MGASTGFELSDGSSVVPDYSVYEDRPDEEDIDHMLFPTIVWESAYTETRKHVNEKAARIIGGSLGQVRGVFAMKIAFSRTADGGKGDLTDITIDVWEVGNTVFLSKINEGDPVEELIRDDGLESGDSAMPTKYRYISEIDEDSCSAAQAYAQYTVVRTVQHIVSTFLAFVHPLNNKARSGLRQRELLDISHSSIAPCQHPLPPLISCQA